MPHYNQPPLTPQIILWLQTTSGNRAVQRLLKRKALERQQSLESIGSQQLEIVPRWPLSMIREHRNWWRWIIQWFRKHWGQ